MKLTDGIYFFKSGENTYLRNVNNARDYLFNEIVFDILTAIKEDDNSSVDSVCKHLMMIYDVENEEEMREDTEIFIQELYEENILIDESFTQVNLVTDVSSCVSAERGNNNKLFSASLELTYRCNEKCIHCYVDDCLPEGRELSFDEYKSVLHQLKELGCISLLLTGGEVCLKKEFIEIARYAVSLGFLVDVYTNGLEMTDEQFDALCEMKVNSVSFSLYGAEASVHDAITKVPGSFEKSLKRAMMFKCAGVDTYIKTVAIKQNINNLESLCKLGRRLGINVKIAAFIIDTHTGISAQPYRLDTQEERRAVMSLIDKYDKKIRIDGVRDMDSSVCNAAFSSLSIDPYGGVHPCLTFSTAAGSVRDDSLKDIWENSDFMNEVRNLRFGDLSPECSECRFLNCCTVCIGSAYEESDKKFCPNSDACCWAEARHDLGVSNKTSCI